IQNLIKIADTLLIGGAMAYTFFRAKGFTTGKSLVEEDKTDLALSLLGEAVERGCRIVLPVDHILARSTEEGAQTQLTGVEGTPSDWMGLDIGPKTVELFRKEISGARTIIWNGPLGMFEKPPFARGTTEIARAVADATTKGATSIVGGGDSVAAVEQAGLADRISHISTGGGASLEFLAGRKLPGVEALTPC
ncbi:MAG: phosphoglycerate kinase, partial [Terriglobales bacterium]